MSFLNKILKRPNNEKPFVLLIVGYPKKNCMIPKFAKQKKDFDNIFPDLEWLKMYGN